MKSFNNWTFFCCRLRNPLKPTKFKSFGCDSISRQNHFNSWRYFCFRLRMENFLLSTTQPVKNYLIQFFSFGFDFTSKSFQALENCLPSTTQSVDEKELQIVWFRFDFTSKLFQALEKFLPSTAQRKNNSSHSVSIRFNFNFKINEVFQPLKIYFLPTMQPVKKK